MHNTSQPWLDHGVYYANTVQVVEPTVRHLLGPDFPTVSEPVDYIRNRLVVIDKKSLGLSTIAALVIAAILPGLSGASAFFAWLVQAVADGIGSVIGLVPGLDGSAASGSVAFLIDASSTPPRLSTIGWIVASALVAALLIWLNQLMQKQTERSIVWDRCPLDVRTWLVLTAIPRALYVLGAAVVVWFAILDWWEPQPDTAWLVVAAVLVAIVAAFVIVEPRFSPAPRVVPEQETLDGRATVLPPTERMRLGIAIASDDYQRELAARRANLAPEGAWATWWAKHFHGWRPSVQRVAATSQAAPAPIRLDRGPHHTGRVAARDELDERLDEPERHDRDEVQRDERREHRARVGEQQHERREPGGRPRHRGERRRQHGQRATTDSRTPPRMPRARRVRRRPPARSTGCRRGRRTRARGRPTPTPT